jgi:hypothetical protein
MEMANYNNKNRWWWDDNNNTVDDNKDNDIDIHCDVYICSYIITMLDVSYNIVF